MAKKKGWIKVWRKVTDNELFDGNVAKLGFWIWCLTKAVTDEGDYPVGNRMVHLKPGEFVFGRRKAAKETGLSESTVSAYLNQLHDCGHVRRHVHAHEYSVVEVVKWGYYQGLEKSHVHDHVHDHVHEVDTIKEDKEEYKNKRHSLSNEREYRKAEKAEKSEGDVAPLNDYERWLREQENDSI